MGRNFKFGKGILALLALAVAGVALALTFNFSFITTNYGATGLSAAYGGTTSTGSSFARGVSISRSDSAQNPYSLVQANPNGGSGYSGPYYLTRRLTTGGAIDTSFGDNGYINTFGYMNGQTFVPLSSSGYNFNRLCLDPGTSDVVLVGNTTIANGTVGVVVRLQPATATIANQGQALVDTSFNASGAGSGIAGVVYVQALANGYADINLRSCQVANRGSGTAGAILVAGDDDAPPCTNGCGSTEPSAGLLVLAQLNANGGFNSSFGTGGIAEIGVTNGTTSLVPSVSALAGDANQSNLPDYIVAGSTQPENDTSGGSDSTSMLAAVNRCTALLDPNFNGTGILLDPSISGSTYNSAALGRIVDNGAGMATDLYVLYLSTVTQNTTTTYPAALVDYSITGAVPDLSAPAGTTSGTLGFPTGFTPKGGADIDSNGEAVVSGNVTTAEELTQIGGSSVLGYTPSTTAEPQNCTAALAPTFSPAANTYTTPQSVTLSDGSTGASIYYTTDGTTPSTSSTLYTGAIAVSQSTTIKAIAAGGNFSASSAASATYTILQPAATPTFSPQAGTYTAAQNVAIQDVSAGVTIYYTTDGSTPTTSSAVYSTPIAVGQNMTVNAIASGGNFTTSAVGTAVYTINLPAAAPGFSPVAGTYTSAQSVALSDTSPGVTIYYTTNGGTPTTSSTQYTAPIAVGQTTTIKAIAAGGSFSSSPVSSAAYTINLPAATPFFSPAAGTYTSAQNVAIKDTSTGVTIYYTTDGSTPTTSSAVYSTPIAVGQNMTINAIASGGNFSASAVGTAAYTINLPAAAPSFSPPAGAYTSAQNVALSDTSAGVTIYYTTNGSSPTTSSTPYTAPIAVSQPLTIKAIAAGGNFSASPVASAAYTLPAAAPTFAIPAGTYTSAQHVGLADASTGVTMYYTTDGSTPTTSSTQYTGPIAVTQTTTINAIAAGGGLGFTPSPVASATYTINLPAATPTFSPGSGTYAGTQTVTISDATAGATIYYTTDGSTPSTSSTVYTAPVTVGPVGSTVTLKAIAAGNGSSAGGVGAAVYVLQTPNTNPQQFRFTAQSDLPPSTLVQSNTVTISGINQPAPISISGGGGEYSIGCNGTFTSAAGTISNGQTVCVELTTTKQGNITASTTLLVGNVSGTFDATTALGSGGSFGPAALGGLGLLAVLRRRRRSLA